MAGAPQCPSEGALLLQISQLNALITLLIGNLNAGDRMKIMTICTIDVHARDVVAKMITAKARTLGRGQGPGDGTGTAQGQAGDGLGTSQGWARDPGMGWGQTGAEPGTGRGQAGDGPGTGRGQAGNRLGMNQGWARDPGTGWGQTGDELAFPLGPAGGELAGLHVAVAAAAPLGRGEEALLCQHLRRPDPVLVRVPGQHAAAGHHPAHRQVRTRRPPSAGPASPVPERPARGGSALVQARPRRRPVLVPSLGRSRAPSGALRARRGRVSTS